MSGFGRGRGVGSLLDNRVLFFLCVGLGGREGLGNLRFILTD